MAVAYGNTTGTANSSFRLVCEYTSSDLGNGYYQYRYRFYVQVTRGNFSGSHIKTSWGSTFTIYGAGTYGATGYYTKNVLSGGAFTLGSTAYAQYTSSKTYRSEISGSTRIATAPTKKFTITYNANGGSGAPSAHSYAYGVNTKLSTVTPIRTGYTFLGWSLSSTATTASYQPGQSWSGSNAANYTLYAVWQINTYTISFDANTGENAPDNQTKTYGIDLSLPLDTPTKTNYNFLGWGTSASSTTVAYEPGSIFSINADTILYAIWELAYTAPRITNVSVDRCSATGELLDSGIYAKIVFSWATDKSVVSIRVGYKEQNTDGFTYVDLSGSGVSGSVDYILNGNFDNETYYDIQIIVTDSIGSNNVIRILEAMKFIIDIKNGGTGIAFNKPASLDGFDVNFDSYFRKPITLIDAGGDGVDWELVPKLQELSDGIDKNANDITNLNDSVSDLNNNLNIEDINELTEGAYSFFYILFSIKGNRYIKCYGNISFESINGNPLSPLYYGIITNLQLTPNQVGFDIEKVRWLNFSSRECSGVFTINQYNGLRIAQSTNAMVANITSLSYYITSPPRSIILTWEVLCRMKTNA